MTVDESAGVGPIRTAEIIAALSLATDLAMGFPVEHGMRSTLVAMRLCEALEVDEETASQVYFLCLLFYVGCNAPADVGWDVFGSDEALTDYATPYRFGTRVEVVTGLLRAVSPPTIPPHMRVWRALRHGPTLAFGFPDVVRATCEVGRMLTEQLGLGVSVSRLFAYESERWDGNGLPARAEGEEIPLAVRIVHVARDAAFHAMEEEPDHVAGIITERAGGAFDPIVARRFGEQATSLLALDPLTSLWGVTLDSEPKPSRMLEALEIDHALAAMGHFSDMAVPEMVGHSSGVAETCRTAARSLLLGEAEELALVRAAHVHDLGRAAVPVRIWMKTGSLTPDEWERVRLHAYQTERILAHSPFLASMIPVAGLHHERLDGSGYHRGSYGSSLSPLARLLAAADVYYAMTEPRPHRAALSPGEAAEALLEEARAGRLAPESVSALLESAGHPNVSLVLPAGLTEREVQVVRLLARGLQTKQIARSLEISPKTADFHIQNAYRKMGVSTRAGATLFAMQNGLTTWENSR